MNFAWLKQHPYMAGGIALGVILVVYMLFGRKGSSSSGSSNLQSYYAAEAAATQSGDALAIAQIYANASVAKTGLMADVYQSNIKYGAQTSQYASYIAGLNTQYQDWLTSGHNTDFIGAPPPAAGLGAQSIAPTWISDWKSLIAYEKAQKTV